MCGFILSVLLFIDERRRISNELNRRRKMLVEDRDRKYHVQLNFSGDRKDELIPGVMTSEEAIRFIKTELGVEPSQFNPPGDVQYDTDDSTIALCLLKYGFTIADGGRWKMNPMPENREVFYLPRRRHD